MWTVVTLDPAHEKDVLPLIAHQVEGVTQGHIGRDGDRAHKMLEQIVGPGELPPDIWLGVRGPGQKLMGAIHAAAHVEVALDASRAKSPAWLRQYVNECLNIEEIAIRKEHRQQGIGRALLEAVHVVAKSNTRDVKNFSAFASGAGATALFERCGYTVGELKRAVPSAYSNGLNLIWFDAIHYGPGRYVYRH